MDSMRSILMMLGILIHSSQIYNPSQTWLVISDNTHPIFKVIIDLIMLFRMPTFFIISGFFCLMMLKKQSIKEFIINKSQRILLPIVSTVLTLNLLQSYLLSIVNKVDFSIAHFFSSGEWVSHLWFLLNLIFYFCLVALLGLITSENFKENFQKKINYIVKIPLPLILLTLPLLSIVIIGLNKLEVPLYSDIYNVITLYKILSYLPYFLFGMIIYCSKELLDKFTSINITVLLTFLIIGAYINRYIEVDNTMLNSVIQVYSEALLSWTIASCIFKFFYLYANQPSKTWSFLSDASYTVYIFHHSIVIYIGLLLVKLEFNPSIGILLLLTITPLITILIHKNIIQKLGLAKLLFNGKY
jgi:glucan biosynthesis protein C